MNLLILEGIVVTGLIRGVIYSLIAMGFSLIFGVTEVCDFAYGEYCMLGSYLAFFIITVSGSPFLAVIVAIGGTFVLGIITDFLTISPLRERDDPMWLETAMIITIGLAMFLRNFAQVTWTAEYKGATYFKGVVNLLGVSISFDRVFAMAFAVSVVVLFTVFIKKTMIGKAIRAVSQDKEAATVLGINSNQCYTLAHALGSMLAGAGGALLLPIYMAYPTVGEAYIITAFTMVIIGGLGSMIGALLAGLILGLGEAFVTVYFPAEYADFLFFAIMVAVLIIRPTGLFGRKL